LSKENSGNSDVSPPVRPELLPGIGFLAIGLALLTGPLYFKHLASYLQPLSLEIAATFLVAAAGFLSSNYTQFARMRGPYVPAPAVRRESRPLPPFLARPRRTWDAVRTYLTVIDWRGDWLPLAILFLLNGLALYAAVKGWRVKAAAPPASIEELLAGILIGVSFPILVIERRFTMLPERVASRALAHLVRLLLLNLLLLAFCHILRWLDLPSWALLAEEAAILLTAAVALELILRGMAYIFVPLPPLDARDHAASFIAGLVRFQKPSFRALSASINRQFGIDLGRSWAIAFVRRAVLPVFLGMVFFSWLLTGVTALGTSERAVYEALGQPRAVLHPGLNFHLPWPLGTLRPVDYGEVREIPIEFTPEAAAPTAIGEVSTQSSIEGPPPPSADRLWDSSHPSEDSYLVADNANGQQSFEVVNIDLRIVYRVGLSDDDARAAVYNIASPPAVIRAASGQMLARYFAGNTIKEVLGQNREAFIRGFQKELQQRLTSLSTGLEVIAVVVEAIHPPADAATAYQGVQAAAIKSVSEIAAARADATRSLYSAQQTAIQARSAATATAAERVHQAEADSVLFKGDYQAHTTGGAVFLFERRLNRLAKGLATKPLIIVDHHLSPAEVPLLDLRNGSHMPINGEVVPENER
jgi:regulator of protease activity HflC (stomatin/prohibitin superfamily)